MKYTWHFDNVVGFLHAESNREDWIVYALAHPAEIQVQSDGGLRHWALIEETGKYMRVVTAFFDRNYTRRRLRRP